MTNQEITLFPSHPDIYSVLHSIRIFESTLARIEVCIMIKLGPMIDFDGMTPWDQFYAIVA